MKEILIAFAGTTYPPHLAKFSIAVANKNHFLCKPVFIPEPNLQNKNSEQLAANPDKAVSSDYLNQYELLNINRELFLEDVPPENFLRLLVPEITTLDHLIENSALVDLMIADAGQLINYTMLDFLLANAECPLLLIPTRPELSGKAIIVYDESDASNHAIEKFEELFEDWSDIPTTLVVVPPKGDNGEIGAEILLRRFPKLNVVSIEGNLPNELVRHIGAGHESPIVVLGCLRGNTISRQFYKSLINAIFEKTNASVLVVLQ